VDEGQTRTLDILAAGFMRDVIVRVHCLKQRSFTSFTGGFRGMCHVQNQSEHCTFQIHDPKSNATIDALEKKTEFFVVADGEVGANRLEPKVQSTNEEKHESE